jgi:hypothetical protein
MIVFASFWDRFRKIFWLVFGSTFGALGGQKVAKMSTKIDAKIGIEKSSFRGGTRARNHPRLVAGGPPLNVGVNLHPRTLAGQAARETLFFYVVFVFVFVMVVHGFLDQFKCHKLSSRVGAVHVFMKLTDLEKYEKGTYI